MKILMINGSPHPHGCTYTALHEMEQVLRATSVKRGARGAIMGGVSFAELCYFVWGRMVLRAKRKIATVLP